MLETEYTSLDLLCPNCLSGFDVPIARVVNVETHPDARLGILLGTMHRPRCPACKQPREIDAIVDYYDPARRLLVQIRPAWEFNAGGEDWYWARYEDLVLAYAHTSVDVRVDVVFGFDQMIEQYLGGAAAVEAARQEWSTRWAPVDSREP